MQYDFDQHIDRSNTNALAEEGFNEYLFGETNISAQSQVLLPLWVADMQFATALPIIEAMQDRLTHPIFGYTANFNDRLYDSFNQWASRRYGWSIEREQMQVSLGVIPALYSLVDLFCRDGGKVLTLTPAYGFFLKAAQHHGRDLITSPLIRRDGRMVIDFDDFTRKAADPKVRLFFLCHPHNPTGRRWTDSELRQLVEICTAHDICVVSDEIHCDLLRSGLTHTPLAKLFPDHRNIVTCMAPSKTFNLAGLMTAIVVITDPFVRAAWRERHFPFANPLGLAAATAAYGHGEEWLEQLLPYLDSNFATLQEMLAERLPSAHFDIPEASYLAWVDLSAYFEADMNLTRYFLKHAGVIAEGGEMFVDNAKGMLRLNVACPKDRLVAAISRISDAVLVAK
tara:strand:- start:182 stop:1372 length:1191 start_codon:yes stop_codon:yes gene_type:complete